MPNWCYSKICFSGNDKAIYGLYNAIQNTYEFIKQMRDLGNVPSWSSIYSDELWIGYVAEYAYSINTNTKNRGFITKIGEIKDCLFYSKFEIEERDAWYPMFAFWDSLIKYVYGDNMIKIYFESYEESGFIHITNDPDSSELYHYNILAEDKSKILNFDKVWEQNESCPLFARLKFEAFDEYTLGMYRSDIYLEDVDSTFAHEGNIHDAIDFLSKYKTVDKNATINDINDIPGFYIDKIKLTSINEVLLDEYTDNADSYYKGKYIDWYPSDDSIHINEYARPNPQRIDSNLFKFINKGGPEE